MTSGKLQRGELWRDAAAAIRTQILRGDLSPGQRLVESRLAAELGTSRGPVRDALTHLASRGLVTMRPRRGCWVTMIAARDVAEIYALRRELEGVAVRQAVEDTDRVSSLVVALRCRLDDLEGAQRCGCHLDTALADMALHREIVEASGYSRVLAAWDRLGDETLLLMAQLSSIDSSRHGPAGDHVGIVDAIEQRDSGLAVELLHRHLRRAERVILEHLGDAPPPLDPVPDGAADSNSCPRPS